MEGCKIRCKTIFKRHPTCLFDVFILFAFQATSLLLVLLRLSLSNSNLFYSTKVVYARFLILQGKALE